MANAQSRVTAQGQISVPASVRKKLGVGPGSVIEWTEQDGQYIVRKAGRHNSVDVHRALFDQHSPTGLTVDIKAGIRARMRKHRARD